MTNKLSDKDKKDWQEFLDSSGKLYNKDVRQLNNQIISERSIDLHGYTLEEANKKITEFIENCYTNKVKKIIFFIFVKLTNYELKRIYLNS